MSDLLVNVDVDDLAKAVEFYSRAFGLRVGRRFPAGAVEMLGASAPVYLLERRSGTSPFDGSPRPRHYARHWTPVHIDFVVSDLEAALRQVQAAGATLEGAVHEAAWGRLARLSDPFGHGVCLVQFQGRGYDEIAEPPTQHAPAAGAAPPPISGTEPGTSRGE